MAENKKIAMHRNCYQMQNGGSSFGKFVVISNETFLSRDLKPRTGTENDVKQLEKTFSRFGFDFKNNIHRDLTATQMQQLIIRIAREGIERYNCLAIAILTHGAHEGSIYGTGPPGDSISIDCLLKPLKESMHIDGKPKLIFIQACRGEDLDSGKILFANDAPSSADGQQTAQQQSFMSIPIEADFLYHFSSSPGYYSFRNSQGSVFIQSLCQVAAECCSESNGEGKGGEGKEEGEEEGIELIRMLTRVNRKVAEEFSSHCPSIREYHDKKQMPCILSMLRKELYLPTTKKTMTKKKM